MKQGQGVKKKKHFSSPLHIPEEMESGVYERENKNDRMRRQAWGLFVSSLDTVGW